MESTWIKLGMRLGNWIRLAGIAVAVCAIGTGLTAAQELVSSADRGYQQTTPAAAGAEPVAVTPELIADMLVAHQEYTKAIEAFQKIQPQTAYTYNKIGMAYQHLSINEESRLNYQEAGWMEDEAKFNYRKAIREDRRYAPAYNNLGTVYFHDKDNKLAQQFYRKAIKLEPKSASLWSNLGAVYLAKRDFSEGAEAYQRAFSLNPNIFQEIALQGIQQHETPQELATMYLCFAEVYAQAGMKVEAVEYLRKALLEGLQNRQKVQQDVQLASLRGTPEFQQLFAKQQLR